MSRRPKQGMGGGRKKIGKQEPLVSEAWNTLATTTISMLEAVGAVNEEATDDCIEEAAQLAEMNKKRMGFQARMQLLDAVTQMLEGFLGALADLDEEQREEHGLAELYENLYGALFSICTESIEQNDKEDATDKSKEESQQQIALTLRAIDVLIAVSFENDEASAMQYVQPFVRTLLELCCTQLCLGGAKYDFFVRQMAMGLLTELFESKHLNPLLSQPEHKELVDLVVDTCYQLCADENDAKKEADEEDEDEDEEDEAKMSLDPNEDTSQNLGTQLLDTLTASLSHPDTPDQSLVAPLILQKSKDILSKADSAPLQRKAALVCLAVLPEAATSFSKQEENLSGAMDLLKKFAGAGEDPLVRSGAFIALSEYLEFLQPEISSHHEEVINTIVQVLSDSTDKSSYLVKIKACIPLQAMAGQKNLPAQFLKADSDKSLPKFLLSQIQSLSSKDASDRSQDEWDLLEELMACLRKMSDVYGQCVKEDSLPAEAVKYLEPIVPETFELMLTLLESSKDEQAWPVRAEAAATLGSLTASQSKDAVVAVMPRLAPLLSASMELVPEDADEEDKLPSEVYELREAVHVCWTGLTKKLGEDVLQYVEAIVPTLCRCLAGDYGASEEDEEMDEEDEEPQMPSGDDDESKAADGERMYALELYQQLIETLGAKFLPFHDRCFEVVTENAKTYSLPVQQQLVSLLLAMPRSLYPLSADVAPEQGVDVSLPAGAKETLLSIRTLLFDYIQHVTDPEIVELSLDALAALTNHYGQVLVNDSPDTLAQVQKMATKLLKRTAPCQMMDPNEVAYFDPSDVFGGFGGEDEEGEFGEESEEEDEEEDEEEEEEHSHKEDKSCCGGDHHHHGEAEDSSLYDGLFNMLGALVKAKGSSVKSTVDALFPRVLKLRKKAGYAGTVSGFFADLAEGLEQDQFMEYAKDIFPLLIADVNNKEFNTLVWRNSSYALGQIFLKIDVDRTQEHLEAATTGMQQILAALEEKLKEHSDASPLSDYEDVIGCRDNVISALGKMLMVGSEHLPRATLLPLFLSGLPLTNDFAESQNVYAACNKLINTYPAAHPGLLEPHFPQLLTIFATVVATQGEKERVSDSLKGFLVKGAKTMLAAQPNLRAEVVDKLDEKIREPFVKRIDEQQ